MTNRQPGLISAQLPPRHPIMQVARDLEVVRQSVDELDAYANQALANLAGPVTARGQYTAGQSIAANTWTPVTWVPTNDPYGLTSTLNPSRFTVPVAGLYSVTANVVFSAQTAAYSAYLSLYVDGAAAQGGTPAYIAPAANTTGWLNTTDLIPCNAGDYLEAYTFTSIASSINHSFVGFMTALLVAATA